MHIQKLCSCLVLASALDLTLSYRPGAWLGPASIGANLTAPSDQREQQQRIADIQLQSARQQVKSHPIHNFDWSEVTKLQVVGCCVGLFFLGIFVSASGIGGGGIFLVTLMMVGGVSPRDAVPLAHAIVMFGATASLIVNVSAKWTSGGIDIDVDTVRMVVPASLLGTLIGFVMNSRIPDVVILKLLVVVLVVLAGISIQIWHGQCQEELAAVENSRQGGNAEGQPLPGGNRPLEDSAKAAKSGDRITRMEMLFSLALLVFVDVCSVLAFHMHSCRAEKQNHTYYGSCQHFVLRTLVGNRETLGTNPVLMDSVLFASQSLPILLCMCLATYYTVFMLSQRQWSVQRVVAMQSMGWATGVIAGLAGIGGGLIYSPFFLITMDPLVAVGTSSTCLLFIAASAALQYAFTDRIIMSLAAVYGAVCFVASILGTILVRQIRHKLPMGKSFITLIVATAVVCTLILTVAKLWMHSRPRIW